MRSGLSVGQDIHWRKWDAEKKCCLEIFTIHFKYISGRGLTMKTVLWHAYRVKPESFMQEGCYDNS